jgi:hypothetical protein
MFAVTFILAEIARKNKKQEWSCNLQYINNFKQHI